MRYAKIIALAALVLLAASGAAPAAKRLLVTGKDIVNGTVGERDLTPAARAKLNRPLPTAVNGAPGERGTDGLAGAPGASITGPQGIPGASTTGAKGDPGPPGADSTVAGPIGPQGVPGDRGIPGTDCTGAPPLQISRQCPGAKGDTGPAGPKGDPCLSTDPACVGQKGDKGDKGDTGEQGPKGDPGSLQQTFQISTGEVTIQAGEDARNITATCPDGSFVVGGGSRVVNGLPVLRASWRSGGSAWVVTYGNPNAGSVTVEVFAYCAT
jgi:hypothetical protein